ncbi:hypothetical protein [Brachybacterium paraconglomeratum]|uniref:Uncharacterized protein n=1 Tax=Brachybacterium paraconglomeratum TaxID=173362 RepID=A0A921KSE6_9MICO|nr:hypothetical protein [Brachybacterium paraconglomeratum]
MNSRWETWGLAFVAIALLLNMLADESPLEYVALVFALAGLVCAVGFLVNRRRKDQE